MLIFDLNSFPPIFEYYPLLGISIWVILIKYPQDNRPWVLSVDQRLYDLLVLGFDDHGGSGVHKHLVVPIGLQQDDEIFIKKQ